MRIGGIDTRARIEGWAIDDGFIRPIALAEPVDVMGALAASGLVSIDPAALCVRESEWVARRVWRYRGSFVWPDEGDERCELSFPRVEGRGEAFVNGALAALFESGELRFEATEFARIGENAVELRFAPVVGIPPDAAPLPPIGIYGDAHVETYNFLSVLGIRARAAVRDGKAALEFRVSVRAHIAGIYRFRYFAAVGGEYDGSLAFDETLPAAARELVRELPVGRARAWSREDRSTVEWKLEIERNGIGCRALRSFCALSGVPPMLRIREGLPISPALRFDAFRALHADAVEPRSKKRIDSSATEDGRRVATDAAFAYSPPPFASLDFHTASRGNPIPAEFPDWRLLGGDALELDRRADRYGQGAPFDADRLYAMTRFDSALRCAAAMARARLTRAPLSVELGDAMPRYASRSLIERGGALTPAFWAVAGAWAPYAAWIGPPEGAEALTGGETVGLPILAFSDAPPEVGLIVASAYDSGGTLLQSVALPAMLGPGVRVGELSLRLPNAEAIVALRAEILVDGAVRCRYDGAVAVRAGGAPMAAIMNPPRARLRASGGRLSNVSETAAFGVSSRAYVEGFRFATLLPGEGIEIGGAGAEAFEWLNGGPASGDGP